VTVRWHDLPVNDWVALNAQLRRVITAMETQGTWDAPRRMGTAYLWVDATGDLRVSATVPTSDTSGTVVGTQS
jgi:hypothetical protein